MQHCSACMIQEQATQHTSSGDAVAADQLVESDMLDCTMDEIVATQHIPNKGRTAHATWSCMA
eukprot:2900203-Amphidinium_carterae.1